MSIAVLRSTSLLRAWSASHLQKVYLPRGGRGRSRGLFPEFDSEPPEDFITEDDPLGFKYEDKIMDMGVLDDTRDKHTLEEQRERKKERTKKFIKTIENKYFRQPQELNLLTWAAKEQIRFLNAEYPELWMPENLAESFPVSKTGVIKILKSTYGPQTIEEIVRHDKRVQKNWLAIQEKSEKQVGPLTQQILDLSTQGKLALLGNASGIPSLPEPKLLEMLKITRKSNNKIGVFESMVKDYCDSKDTDRSSSNQDSGEALLQLKSENRHMIDCVMKAKHIKKLLPSGTQSLDSGNTVGDFDASKGVSYMEFSSKEPVQNASASNDTAASEIEKTVLKGTHSVNNQNINRTPIGRQDFFPDETTVDSMEQYSKTQRKVSPNVHKIKDNIKIEKPFTQEEDESEIYMYDDSKGYQFPFGRKSKLPKNIDMEKIEKDKRQKLYQRGKDYFDEDGEFLYRVP